LKCIRCGKCLEACPEQAIEIVGDTRVIEWARCSECMKCAEACPSGAIEAAGKTMSVEEVMDTVARDASYYARTDGGMTVSGGEPLVPWRFASRLLQEAKRRGFHTALDTTGHGDWEVLDELLGFTDLVLFDVKHVDSARHQQATGVPNERILENLRRTVAKPGLKVWVRHPVIPRFSDSEQELEELCKLVLTLKPPVEKISLLPYHKFGERKYPAMGKEYPWKGIPTIADGKVEEFKRLVESHGIKADVGR
jgi:pyruvate formate lyase activating enzyme